MKKTGFISFIIISLVIIVGLSLGIKRTKTVDWSESFNEKSNKPYGVSIFYNELPKVFKAHEVRTVYHNPAHYLQDHSEDGNGNHIAKGSFIIIGNSDYLGNESVDALLKFVDKGNTLFISDYYFVQTIHDTLQLDVSYVSSAKDSITYMSLKDGYPDYIIDKNVGINYFSRYDSITNDVLGYAKTDEKHVNFLKVPFGDGQILLHLEPKAFTNYNMLKENRYKYVEGLLAYLPPGDIYFDSYTKRQSGLDHVDKKSNLSWFLDQLSFKWAWYTALVFTILFIIFNAKRRQRIIKIIKPLQNTTLAFVKTISHMYYEIEDHENIINKKITYFLEKIRTDYHLDTSILDDEFISKLASKLNRQPRDIKELIDYINLLKSSTDYKEEHLLTLNKYIENIYST